MKNTILLHDHDTFLYTPHKWESKHTPSRCFNARNYSGPLPKKSYGN